jgi:hypothetical protein
MQQLWFEMQAKWQDEDFLEQIVVGGVFLFCKIVLCFAKTIYLHAKFLYHNQLNTTLDTAAVFVLASN